MVRVVPVWVKVAGLLVIGFFCLQLFSEKAHREEPGSQVVTPGPSIERGLAGKVVANTRTVSTRLFSPVVEPERAPVIIRESGDQPYYKDAQ
ncbi:hypothetical protein B5V00_06845 [Geothermobacter hydrogeniphilus]|uniref:Uncharacterized protein n=2 Tax=Geothermobacter hydrogeniphilus TaxID=1969733 RepID=A0A1X0Y8J6_9BACT|nr:hypothetical protein B5V00_06845 [Geothermobacter hydrogeniphilus]